MLSLNVFTKPKEGFLLGLLFIKSDFYIWHIYMYIYIYIYMAFIYLNQMLRYILYSWEKERRLIIRSFFYSNFKLFANLTQSLLNVFISTFGNREALRVRLIKKVSMPLHYITFQVQCIQLFCKLTSVYFGRDLAWQSTN